MAVVVEFTFKVIEFPVVAITTAPAGIPAPDTCSPGGINNALTLVIDVILLLPIVTVPTTVFIGVASKSKAETPNFMVSPAKTVSIY